MDGGCSPVWKMSLLYKQPPISRFQIRILAFGFGLFYYQLPNHTSIPQISSWLLNQTLISTECMRSLSHSIDNCSGCRRWQYGLRQLSVCMVADWLYTQFSLQHLPEWGCVCVAHVSCCPDKTRVGSSSSWHSTASELSMRTPRILTAFVTCMESPGIRVTKDDWRGGARPIAI